MSIESEKSILSPKMIIIHSKPHLIKINSPHHLPEYLQSQRKHSLNLTPFKYHSTSERLVKSRTSVLILLVAKLNIASQGAGLHVIGKVLKEAGMELRALHSQMNIRAPGLSVTNLKPIDFHLTLLGNSELLRKGYLIPILQVKTPQLAGS